MKRTCWSLSVVVAVIALASCGSSSSTAGPDAAASAALGPVNPSASPKPKHTTIRLRVLKRSGSTVALADVVISGHPLVFIVDTGATTTLVTQAVATELKLPTVGKPVHVTGVAGGSVAHAVRVNTWTLGGSRLPASNVVTLADSVGGTAGLLGSDILSRFGKITIDYERQTATLG